MSSADNPSISSLREELSLRERQIDAIRRISGELFAHLDVDDMLCKTLTVAVEVLGADVGSLQIHDPDTGHLTFRCVLDPAAARLLGTSYPISQGIGGLVFRTGQGQITERAREQDNFNPEIDNLTGYRTESMLTAPLHCFNKPTIGIMQVLNARRPFDQSDLAVLETLGAHAAAAIETARMAEDAKRAELVNVIGDIAHDIKNLLTPLTVGVDTLQMIIEDSLNSVDTVCRQCPPHESWGHDISASLETLRINYDWVLKSTQSAAERVNTSTREITEAVKGELSPPHFEMNNFNDVAREVVATLLPVAESANIELRAELDARLPQSYFDQRQLFNAIFNLVNNAIPETPPGGSIVVRSGVRNDEIWLEVRDTGRGIPAEIKRKLFTDAAISTKIYGTGLGTRIVASTIRRHGGRIHVESAEGQGATFTIQLPIRRDLPATVPNPANVPEDV